MALFMISCGTMEKAEIIASNSNSIIDEFAETVNTNYDQNSKATEDISATEISNVSEGNIEQLIEESEETNNAQIPDGIYDTALGVYGKNQNATFELYSFVTGNLKNARIDSTSNTLIVEAGFIHDEDSSIIIPYGIYELPLSPDCKIEAGTGDGPMDYSKDDFNDLFYDNSTSEGLAGFGFSIWLENGTVNRILCWGS